FSCSVGVTPRLVRTQGYAELAGDIVLTCTGGPTATGSTNLTLFLNTQITSHILNTSTNTSEALLAIDDLASPGVLGVNLFQGIVNSDQKSLTFQNVPVMPGATHTYRLTNLRVNAAAIPSGGVVQSLLSTNNFAFPIVNPMNAIA